jgi:hypothetical protein
MRVQANITIHSTRIGNVERTARLARAASVLLEILGDEESRAPSQENRGPQSTPEKENGHAEF